MKKFGYILVLHILPIIILSFITLSYLDHFLVWAYSILSFLFIINTAFALYLITNSPHGVFNYLINILFLLGFWFKYSIQKISQLNYREPIGQFVINSPSEANVLWVINTGICALFLAQTTYFFLFRKSNHASKSVLNTTKQTNQIKKLSLITILALILAAVNLKFNILLFGFKPSLTLPFKGNAVYFLAIVRAIPFLLFYLCFRQYSRSMFFWGGLVALICSVGVLSRMTVLCLYAVFFIFILQNIRFYSVKKIASVLILFTSTFILFSYATVLISTGLREHFNDKRPFKISLQPQKIKRAAASVDFQYFAPQRQLNTYMELAMGRWIGIEGIMAVESYPQKGFSLLFDGLKEKSYSGNSFYSKIAQPNKEITPVNIEIISTSVPGPIAFFYYSGSISFVFIATFLCIFICNLIERSMLKLFSQSALAAIFISVFMVFDFFQFGISPQAFVRYWVFSFSSLIIFYLIFIKKIYRKVLF